MTKKETAENAIFDKNCCNTSVYLHFIYKMESVKIKWGNEYIFIKSAWYTNLSMFISLLMIIVI